MQQHYQVGGALQRRPRNDDNAPWVRDGQDDSLREMYEANAPLILEPRDFGPLCSVYNFPIDIDITLVQLMRYANEIFTTEQRAFPLNIVFGTILQHRESGVYRFFVPYNNNGIFERPFYISDRSDLNSLRLRLRRIDIIGELLRQRPNTKWLPVLLTNVHFTVFGTNYPLGYSRLPDYLLWKDSIYPLVKNQQTRKYYDDNLCLFRCLALHMGHDIRSLERPANDLFNLWSKRPVKSFNGLTFEFPGFEKRFQVNMEFYSLTEDGFAHSIYKSRGQNKTMMFVNLYENHVSYTRNFAGYAQKYQ